MTEKELFEKYDINESHSKWESIDSWMSVELFRFMNNRLPNENDIDLKHVIDFLDKMKNDKRFFITAVSMVHFGSLYLTAKRMIYRFSEDIIKYLK